METQFQEYHSLRVISTSWRPQPHTDLPHHGGILSLAQSLEGLLSPPATALPWGMRGSVWSPAPCQLPLPHPQSMAVPVWVEIFIWVTEGSQIHVSKGDKPFGRIVSAGHGGHTWTVASTSVLDYGKLTRAFCGHMV